MSLVVIRRLEIFLLGGCEVEFRALCKADSSKL